MATLSVIIFILFCYGASNQIVYTSGPLKVYDGLKKFGIWVRNYLKFDLYHMLICMICLPTWFGIGLSAIDLWVVKDLAFTPTNLIIGDAKYWWLMLIIDGGIASGSSWFIHSVQNWFEKTAPEETSNVESDGNNLELLHD